MRSMMLLALAAGLLAVFSGCCAAAAAWGGYELLDQPTKRTISGAVNLDHHAVEGAVVSMTPEEFQDEAVEPSLDVTGSDGKYSIKYRWFKYRHYTISVVYSDPGIDGNLETAADNHLYAYSKALENLELADRELNIDLSVAPQALLSADVTSGTLPLTVNFTAGGSSDEDGSIDHFEWDLDGDGVYNEPGGEADAQDQADCQAVYSAAGSTTVMLRVTDNGDNTDTAQLVITVLAP